MPTTPLPAPAAPQPAAPPPPAAAAPPSPAAATQVLPPASTPAPLPTADAWRGPPEVDRVVGQVLGGYQVLRRVAEGGMGVIYEGRHTKLARRGAIKVLRLEYCQSDDVVERFYQEARAVNEIHHENIVDVYDFGRDADGRVFFVMEFLEGESLAGRLARGPMPFGEALPVLEQVIRALKAAHDKGFVHRDLKPDNIWLKHRDDGAADVRLLDFGIAKLVGLEGAKEKLTRTGAIIGTPTYMSPEQINGSGSVDARTDIYSLGIIVYELFTGAPPFGGDSLSAIMVGHLFNEPPPLINLPPALGVPDAVAHVVARMLAKEAGQRYQSVNDVIADLRSIASNREPTVVSRLDREQPRTLPSGIPHAGPPSITAPPPAAAPAGRRFLAPILGLALAGAGIGGYFALRGDGEPRTDPAATVAQPTPSPEPGTGSGPGTAATPPAEPTLDYQQIGSDARGVLRGALAHSEPRVRVHSADGVGTIQDRTSEPKLLALVAADPDDEVRGHAASALGALGAEAARDPLAKAEKQAAPPLRVWYAGALSQLGDRSARKRLIKYAKEDDLAVAFRAALVLADHSEGGDKDAVAALTRLVTREAELNDVAPYAGAVLLTKLASLRQERARGLLYQILEDKNERTRLAAAEGLARLGDEAALAPLQATLADPASANRLIAAVALTRLGDYAGFELMKEKLVDPDPEVRRLAARGLGDIGEKTSVAALRDLLTDRDGGVQVAGAVALIMIVGLEPMVLAQASIDWARGALDSEDWAVRRAGAGVLGDLPESAAVPLLAQSFLDERPDVRRAAARSARKLKSPAAAQAVASAALAEKDPAVQAEQVRALGTIADRGTLPAVQELAKDPGAVGILAAGSLIALGERIGKDRLDVAIADRRVELRQAAVEAAVLAGDPIVVPTLVTGARDRVFDVRFASAEGLARYRSEDAVAVPVLEEGLAQRDLGFQARARAALLGFGKAATGGTTPQQLLEALDPAVRQGAAVELAALPWLDARPLVRRMLADPDAGVRARGLDVVDTSTQSARPDAIQLYKSLIDDRDAAVRAKAQAQLAKIAEPLTPGAPTAPAIPAAPPPDAGTALAPDAAAATGPDTGAVDAAAAEADTARGQAQAAGAEIDQLAKDLDAAIIVPAEDDRDIRKVKEFARSARTVRDRVVAARDRATAAATRAEAAAKATPSPEATARAAGARAAAEEATALAKAAETTSDELDKKADDYASTETDDVAMLVSAADTAIASGQLTDARRDLEKAEATGQRYPAIKFSYGRLYDGLAKRAKSPDDRLNLLKKAKRSYDAFASSGSGPKVARARERSSELTEEIAELEAAP